uniref:Dolichyl-diphosphooligosaccharide--protein glycosyltransferase subunit 1 n=1 Tax=Steinernema glaseri TaxID=37863 RepID=A0A1I8A985_9BILA
MTIGPSESNKESSESQNATQNTSQNTQQNTLPLFPPNTVTIRYPEDNSKMILTWASLLLCCALASGVAIPKGVSITSATRRVDIASQVVKVSTDFVLQNSGDAELTSFIYAIPKNEADHVAFVSASQGKNGNERLKANIVTVDGASADYVYHKIDLAKNVAAQGTGELTVFHTSTDFLKPYPAEITQTENQFVLYNGDAHIASVYEIAKEITTFQLTGDNVLSFTEVSPSKKTGDRITYGPYTNQKPFSSSPVTIHYENNSPFVAVVSLERTIEVSHWGNIAVEEKIELLHKGAALSGPFSRLDYQLDRRGSKQPVVKSYKTVLPGAARDIYYRDLIGNISTSSVRKVASNVEVELRPRFPLFGGWKTNYVLGYNLPTSEFLSANGDEFQLRMKAIDRIFDNAVIDHATIKIIIPEGSTNIKLVTPYSVKRAPDTLHYTYLDISGRPVITFEKDNVVDKHGQKFTLKYQFSRIYILREPFIVVSAFLLLFLAVIVYTRLDFSLSPERHQD